MRWFRRDDESNLVEQMRALWPREQTATRTQPGDPQRHKLENPRLKPRTLAEWTKIHGRKRA